MSYSEKENYILNDLNNLTHNLNELQYKQVINLDDLNNITHDS